MSIIKYRPFKNLTDSIFNDDFIDHFMNSTPTQIPVDIYEKNDEIHIDFELPGLDKKNIDIELDNDVLTVNGEFKKDDEVKDEDYYRCERYYGEFSRSFNLPNHITEEDVNAEFDNGILKVSFPKKTEKTPKKKIEIK